MMNHPTLDKLQKLKLTGMVSALADQMSIPDIDELDFMESCPMEDEPGGRVYFQRDMRHYGLPDTMGQESPGWR